MPCGGCCGGRGSPCSGGAPATGNLLPTQIPGIYVNPNTGASIDLRGDTGAMSDYERARLAQEAQQCGSLSAAERARLEQQAGELGASTAQAQERLAFERMREQNQRAEAALDRVAQMRIAAQRMLADVLAHVDTVTANLSRLTTALNREFVDQSGIRDLHTTLRETQALIAKLGRLADQQNAELTRTQQSLRRVADAVDSAKVNAALKGLTNAGNSTAELATELKATSQRLDAVLAKVESGNGSAARLLNDDGLYRDTRALLQRLDSLTADFKRNPKKYVKLSIF